MAVSSDFLDFVLDQFSDWGGVSIRRMFGGAGLYRDGQMFGVIASDVAYLKVDDASRDDFLRAGSAPFNPYPDKVKTAAMSYYEIPPEVLENREELCRWAQRSLAIQKGWFCPRCRRRFDRARQEHSCRPSAIKSRS